MPSLRERVQGALLGGAIGDALGAPVEFDSLEMIRRTYGDEGITDFVPAYGRLGAITDDTQMTLFTAEGLLWASDPPSRVAPTDPVTSVYQAYLRWLTTQGRHPAGADTDEPSVGLFAVPELHSLRGPGTTCLTALSSGEMGTMEDRLNDSKGCGGVMRVAPVGLWDAVDPFDLGCRTAAITHGHPSGFLSAGFLAEVIAHLIADAHIDEAVERARASLARRPESAECLHAVERALELATTRRASPETVAALGRGWVGEEALAIGLYCARTTEDFAFGVGLAVNHDGDSDSTGSIAGTILGARLGVPAIPNAWVKAVELSETITAIADQLAGALLTGQS